MLKKIKALILFGFIASAMVLAAHSISSKAAENAFNLQTDASGADLFKANCARCHGEDAKGGKGPNLTTEKKQAKWRDSDEKLVRKITNGGFGMPKFGKRLKPEEIKAIAAYVRSLRP
jgi:cbb3-type cytochrome c oxidase subunit III